LKNVKLIIEIFYTEVNILIDINDANNIYSCVIDSNRSCIFDSNMFTIFGIALARSLRSRYP